MSRDARGFSIIEVIFSVAVLVTLLGMGVSAAGPRLDNLAVRGAADEFRAAHEAARSIAIRTNHVAELRINADSATFWVQVDSTLAGGQTMDTIGMVTRLSDSRVTLASKSSVLCFDSRGIPSSRGSCDGTQSGVVVFTRGSEVDSVSRSLMGVLAR